MIDVSTVSTIVVTVSVVAGVVFTVLEIRHLARTRRTDVIMKIYERFSSREMVEAIYSVGRLRSGKFGDSAKGNLLVEITQLAVLFEGVGVLLEQKLIDIKLVDSFFGPSLDSLWEPMHPMIVGMRESLKQPFMFSHFEDLYNRLSSYRKENVKAH